MQIEPEFKWVTNENCNKPVKIAGYNHKDKLLLLLDGIDSVQMSLYGKNFNYLYNTFGNETDNWIGKTIKIKTQLNEKGKNIRTIYT